MARANIHRIDMKKVMCSRGGLLRNPAFRGPIDIEEVGKKELHLRF